MTGLPLILMGGFWVALLLYRFAWDDYFNKDMTKTHRKLQSISDYFWFWSVERGKDNDYMRLEE